MGKLNIEFMNEDLGFVSKNEDDLDARALYCVLNQTDFSKDHDLFEQMSEYRCNLLDWYNFEDHSRILEIGAGYGTISRMLALKASCLVCVEKKRSRAEIIKQRLRDKDNVTVLNMNFKDYSDDEKFDYIIVHDISGYLKKYYDTKNALYCMLSQMRGILANGGKILFSIENRLGLKYFAGAPEDYSGKFFTGLNGFDGYTNIKTYTKEEITDIARKSGFGFIEFYYPYPNADFPTEIFTDMAFQTIPYGNSSKSVGNIGLELFDERRLWRTLDDEGVIKTFVNSFLVEISDSSISPSIVYHRINDRLSYNKYEVTIRGENSDRFCEVRNGSHKIRKKIEGLRLDKCIIDALLEGDYDTKFARNKVGELIDGLLNKVDVLVESAERILNTDSILFDIKDVYYCDGEYSMVSPYVIEKGMSVNEIRGHLIREFYDTNIKRCSDYEALYDLKRIIDKYGSCITNSRVYHENGCLQDYYLKKYTGNMIYPMDALRYGDPIIDFIDSNDEKLKEIQYEQAMLDELRRDVTDET